VSASAPSRYECGVCWHVYDPAEGDPVWQVAPGTRFEDLPEEWCCPNCDSPQARFMRVADDG
jgi:rubredoxin